MDRLNAGLGLMALIGAAFESVATEDQTGRSFIVTKHRLKDCLLPSAA